MLIYILEYYGHANKKDIAEMLSRVPDDVPVRPVNLNVGKNNYYCFAPDEVKVETLWSAIISRKQEHSLRAKPFSAGSYEFAIFDPTNKESMDLLKKYEEEQKNTTEAENDGKEEKCE